MVYSNDDSLSAADMALGYKQLQRVEQAWRRLKSGLRLRPVYHWTPQRIRAHISLTVLALLLERVAEQSCTDTWRNIQADLRKFDLPQLRRSSRCLHTHSASRKGTERETTMQADPNRPDAGISLKTFMYLSYNYPSCSKFWGGDQQGTATIILTHRAIGFCICVSVLHRATEVHDALPAKAEVACNNGNFYA